MYVMIPQQAIFDCILHLQPHLTVRSYWIPGSYAPTVSEKRSAFLRSLKNKGFKEGGVAKVGADDLDKTTTLESNKSLF